MDFVRIAQVAVALGLLIFVHELGHFLAAKWAGVRVEVFSFGFGPFLLSFRKGETIYALSLIPLGGYVRMTGQSDVGRVKEEERRVPHSYLAKSPGKRGVIIAAGVVMNVVFAFLLFALAYMAGIRDVPPLVGGVVPGSPADDSGLSPRDRVVSVDGTPVDRFSDVQLEIATRGDKRPVAVGVRRADGSLTTLDVTPRKGSDGIAQIGVSPPFARVRVGVALGPGLSVLEVGKDTPAAKAGLEAWDYVETVDGRPFDGLLGFKAALRRAALAGAANGEAQPGPAGGREVALGVRRGEGRERVEIRLVPLAEDDPLVVREYVAGFHPWGHVVESVVEGGAAAAAGLEAGDVLAGASILPDGRRAEIVWVRRGADPKRKAQRAVVPIVEDGPEITSVNLVEEVIGGEFLGAFGFSAREGVRSVRKTFATLVSLLDRTVPMKHMSSIIGIAVVTYRSTERGTGFYLWLVAFLSVNLAVINLFPMVPLDGGLLLFLLYEAVRGKQASQRVQEIAQAVGLVLILALVIFVLVNDAFRFLGGPT